MDPPPSAPAPSRAPPTGPPPMTHPPSHRHTPSVAARQCDQQAALRRPPLSPQEGELPHPGTTPPQVTDPNPTPPQAEYVQVNPIENAHHTTVREPQSPHTPPCVLCHPQPPPRHTTHVTQQTPHHQPRYSASLTTHQPQQLHHQSTTPYWRAPTHCPAATHTGVPTHSRRHHPSPHHCDQEKPHATPPSTPHPSTSSPRHHHPWYPSHTPKPQRIKTTISQCDVPPHRHRRPPPDDPHPPHPTGSSHPRPHTTPPLRYCIL